MAISMPWPLNQYTSSAVEEIIPEKVQPPSLVHYATPGKAPPTARVDPETKRRESRPIRLWDAWRYGLVATSKATEMTSDFLSHHLFGPKRKSWGIEMTLATSLMRGAAKHTELINIGTIRALMSLAGLLPLPSDALVTPVTWRVRRRKLRGILAEFDASETGSRELSGEWVVGRKTWQRLQAEWKASSQKNPSASSREPSKRKERVILYIHGGAYYLSSAAAQRLVSIPLSKYTDARVFAIDYRLAPETRFPGPLHDAVSAYFRLIDDLHVPSENIIIAGDSAGGGLSLALLMYLRDNEYPLPSGAILMSPWVDLTMSCESWDSNADYDVVPMPSPDDPVNPVYLYLGENMSQYLTHPYASPLFGEFNNLPPLLIQAGDAEVLRDEITLLAHKATVAGVDVQHELYEDAIHVFQLYPFLESARKSFLSMRDFVKNVLPHVQSRTLKPIDDVAEKEIEHEIDNECATVVRGDGIKTASGLQNVHKELDSSNSRTSTDSEEENSSRSKYSSWSRASNGRWSISSFAGDTDEGDEETETDCSDPGDQLNVEEGSDGSVTRRRRRAETLPSGSPSLMSGLPSMESMKSFMTVEPLSPPPTPRLTHTRTRSWFSRQKENHPGPIDIPSHSTSNGNTPLPSPSIRRSSRNTSHPDLSNLVDNWTQSGPANATRLFRTGSRTTLATWQR